MSRCQRFFCALIPVLFTVACGSKGGSPTGPGAVQFPNVAGNYSGTTTFNYPELGGTVTCSTTTSVTQNGDQVSVAPLQLRGSGCSPSIPVGDTTIDRNGSLGQDTGRVLIDGCDYTYASSGGFFGRSLQASIVYSSRICYNMNVTFNLTR